MPNRLINPDQPDNPFDAKITAARFVSDQAQLTIDIYENFLSLHRELKETKERLSEQLLLHHRVMSVARGTIPLNPGGHLMDYGDIQRLVDGAEAHPDIKEIKELKHQRDELERKLTITDTRREELAIKLRNAEQECHAIAARYLSLRRRKVARASRPKKK